MNLPDSELKRQVDRAGRPYLNALGLDQGWGAFAPEPRRTSIDLVARIRYEDGTQLAWHYPRGGPVFAAYTDYRWRKWLEWMVVYEQSDLRTPLAAWLARRERAAGRRPLRVVLVARWRSIPPPSWQPEAPPTKLTSEGPAWSERQFYSVWITPALLGDVTVG